MNTSRLKEAWLDSIAHLILLKPYLPTTISSIPVELLDPIVDYLVTTSASRHSTYRTLSVVSKHFRSVTVPLISHEFILAFSADSFYHLLSLSESSFAPYVHHIRY